VKSREIVVSMANFGVQISPGGRTEPTGEG